MKAHHIEIRASDNAALEVLSKGFGISVSELMKGV
jgi:hypothetical protein